MQVKLHRQIEVGSKKKIFKENKFIKVAMASG